MPKYFLIPVVAAIFLLSVLPTYTQNKDVDQIPEGMELIEIGQTKVLVPKGSRIEKKGGLVLLENVDDYVARKIDNLESRMTSLEARIERLEIKLERLTRITGQLKEENLTSPEEDD